jgi:hypothetical protein
MLRVAAILAVLLTTTAATAQQSFHPKTVVDPEEGLPLYKRKFFPPEGYIAPDQQLLAALARVAALPPSAPVVMTRGNGGRLDEHRLLFATYRDTGTKVELRGDCFSACTIITTYVAKENLCIAPGAFLAFHAARVGLDGPINGGATIAMVEAFPPEIRGWIDRHGGVGKLPRDGFWTMYDHELWAIGYPRCK